MLTISFFHVTPVSVSMNPRIRQVCSESYPPELQLNKANTSDTEAPFLDLHLSISNGLFHLKFMISAMTLSLM